MAWFDFDDEDVGAFDLGGFGDFSFEDTGAFDIGGIDLGGLDLGALDFNVGAFDLGGLDLSGLNFDLGDTGAFDLGGLDLGNFDLGDTGAFDLGGIGDIDFSDTGAFDLGGIGDIDFSDTGAFDLGGIGDIDFSDTGAFDLGGFGGVDFSDTGAFDMGGFGGIDLSETGAFDMGGIGGVNLSDTGAFDISGAEDLGGGRLENGNLVFDTDQGKVIYREDGTVETIDKDGSHKFYTSNEGRDYFVDYSDPTKLGAPVDIYGRAEGGEGPTRYTQYSGTGKDAKVVDYSDVYGPGGGTVTTTSDGKTTRYEDGKVFQDITTEDLKTKTTDTKTDDTKSIKEIINQLTGGKDNTAMLAALLGGLLGLLNRPKGTGATGYKGSIPKYTSVRGKPGEGTRLVKAAGGGLMGLASGGAARPARYLRGGTDGMADKIQTNIDGKQPARLSHGEFVIPADVVSHLGNGNSDAGAEVLYDMMGKVRKARTGTAKQGKQINPRKYTPA